MSSLEGPTFCMKDICLFVCYLACFYLLVGSVCFKSKYITYFLCVKFDIMENKNQRKKLVLCSSNTTLNYNNNQTMVDWDIECIWQAQRIEIEDHIHFGFFPFDIFQCMVVILVFVNLHSKNCFLLFHCQFNLMFNILSFLILGFCFHLLFIFFSSLNFCHVVLIYVVTTKKNLVISTIF